MDAKRSGSFTTNISPSRVLFKFVVDNQVKECKGKFRNAKCYGYLTNFSMYEMYAKARRKHQECNPYTRDNQKTYQEAILGSQVSIILYVSFIVEQENCNVRL